MVEAEIGFRYVQQISDEIEFRKGIDGQVKVDMVFLTQFCLCLENWDFTTDEVSKVRFRSIITDHDAIWAKEHNGRSILDCVIEMGFPVFPSVIVELERRIQQSKLLIEGWCGILLPSLMQWKPSTMENVNNFLSLLQYNLEDVLSFRAEEFVPFGNNIINILTKMIVFLNKLLEKVEYVTDSKNSIEFLKFVSAFSNKTACLVCLYWAKEEANIVEISIILFNKMMLEFIPCALDVMVCYLGLLRSAETFQFILLEETVESFVELFFGHLDTNLKEEFPILRDWLIYLFIVITDDHPLENVDEEDSIRSQIYGLLKEHSYLLLSFDEMKEDFFNNNMILRDFIIKIEIATNANLRQGHYGFSEAVKMDHFYFVMVQRALCAIQKHAEWAPQVHSQLQLYRMELRFLRQSLLWFESLDDSDEEIMASLSSVIVSLRRIWGSEEEEEEKGFLAARLDTMRTGRDITEWHQLAFELERKIELSKLEISTHLVNEFHWSLGKKPSTINKVLKFIDSILHNLNTLVSCRAGKILSFKKQIETLEDKLAFLQNMLKLVENCTYGKDMGEFIMFVQLFAYQAARLTILYWVKEANDEIATEINLMLSRMLQKIKPVTRGVARLYFETLKAIYSQRSDPLLFGQTVTIFVDFAFEDHMTLFKNDFQILRDDVIFLLTFLNHPPDGSGEELVSSQIDNSFWEDIYDLLSIDNTKRDFSDNKVFLDDFMMKIKALNAKIRNLYCDLPGSSMYNLPKITSPWYLDFLIQNLRNLKERMITDSKIVLFVKYKIIKIEEELVSLCPYFNYIFELQNELNDIWLQVVDLIHLCERVINSCVSSWFVFDHPIWYYMSHFEDVFDKIKIIKKKLEKIEENNMHNVCFPPHSAGVIGTRLKQDWSSDVREMVVGFDDTARKLIDDLLGAYKPLDTIWIVGMGGLGKTTLARKVFSSEKCKFDISAFYTVSEDTDIKTLLVGLLKYIIKVDDEISRMTKDDLAHKLWKCLSGKKYLIVLDDIWHTSVWTEVKRSLPEDHNESRVMFTTRFHNVANECKMKCSPFEMPFLSDDDSWELLQKKVFQNGISPPNLFKVGRQIAESCKGLPLSIVVIAGLLTRKERSPSSWSEIADKLFSFLSDEGCVKILELSYNHLPEYLKPCLLYLGAFPEDNLFRVNQIVRLWIAEGFVHEYETKCIEDMAKKYFQDLVDRSLVIVSSRGSGGQIKTFIVHDLIHKLCQTKCHEQNFFKLGCGIAASSSMYDNYRISDVVAPTIGSGSLSLGNASTVLLVTHQAIDSMDSLISNLKLAQVLYVENKSEIYKSVPVIPVVHLTSLVNLRHIECNMVLNWMPSSISNLWNIQSLILTAKIVRYLPETFWKMKSLRHVKVRGCILQFSDGHEQLDKVVNFSSPLLYSRKEVERLLQRLPVVQNLGITLITSFDYVHALDFWRKLESLKISAQYGQPSSNLIKFPSTLKKLTLEGLHLPLTTISSIAEIHFLRVLKLRRNTFTEPGLEMVDLAFNHLVFFELHYDELVEWNASSDSFPCLEQLSIECLELKELPSCFGEISALKMIDIRYSSPGVVASSVQIQEDLIDLGNKVELRILHHG